MKKNLQKAMVLLLCAAFMSGFSITALAASETSKTGWQSSQATKEENNGTLDEAQTEIGLNGYVGNVSSDAPGIDIDEDGKVDYVVEQDKIIEASIPAKVGIVATGNMDGGNFKVNFICPTIAIVNENEKKPIQVNITGAEVTGGSLTLKSFSDVNNYTSDDFGLKVIPARKGDFAEQDVTTLKGTSLMAASRLTGAIGYTLGAQYTAAMLDAHAGKEETKPEVTIHYGLTLVS